MRALRPSITTLMAVVILAGLAFAALRSASELWFSAFYTATVLLLLRAVVSARFRRGDARAFWFGFAVFGWGVFLLAMGPWKDPAVALSQGIGDGYNQNLLTYHLVRVLVAHLRRDAVDLGDIDKVTIENLGIVHLMMTLLLATLGGAAAVLMRRRGRVSARPGAFGRSKLLLLLAGLALIPAIASLSRSARPPTRFFPDPGAEERGEFTERRMQRYSEVLEAMREPSLWTRSQRDGGATAYRLLWLPSFDYPVCVRIEGSELRAVALDGHGGYDPGMVAIDRRLTLNPAQRADFLRRVEAVKFWSLPTTDNGNHGTDGDRLVLEGVRGGRYHRVDWEEPDSNYVKFCQSFLALSRLGADGVFRDYHGEELQE